MAKDVSHLKAFQFKPGQPSKGGRPKGSRSRPVEFTRDTIAKALKINPDTGKPFKTAPKLEAYVAKRAKDPSIYKHLVEQQIGKAKESQEVLQRVFILHGEVTQPDAIDQSDQTITLELKGSVPMISTDISPNK
jgi:hypothetical protein